MHGLKSLAIASSVLLCNGIATAENYAFLVAVCDYDVKHLKPLAYTRNDILKFQQVLLDTGFNAKNIVVLHDDLKQLPNRRYIPNADEIRKEFALLLSAIDADDTLIVALSGHGVQFKGEQQNYFCPANADLDDPNRKQLIPLSELYDQLNQCPAKKKLLLVDACRNDPQSQLAKSRDSVNLESVTRPQTEPVPEGIVALFSCAAGQQSFEYPNLQHGIFFHHVLTAWNGDADDGDKELTLDELIAFTRKETQAFARLNLATIQTPESKGSFAGTWVLRKLDSLLTNSIGMRLRRISAGEFLMGSPVSEAERRENEGPQHRVQITKPFYLGIHPVTVAQFRQFVDAGNYRTDAESDGIGGASFDQVTGELTKKPEYTWKNPNIEQADTHPVVQVSWRDATAFCQWLSQREGKTYRLPTEAEWELACRAGTTTPFNVGTALSGQDANIKGDEPYATNVKVAPLNRTSPVGSYAPNAYGLFDMHGNVWEWCQDWYQKDYYAHSPSVDPAGPATGSFRVVRGGNWRYTAARSRSAGREGFEFRSRINFVGFRVAMTP